MKINLKQITSYILGATLVLGGVVVAGSLTPTVINTNTPSFVTVSDLYNKITNNTFSVSTHAVSTTTSPASSMFTLTQVYNAIPTIDASKIATGTTYMGVVGTLSTTTNLIWSTGTSNDYWGVVESYCSTLTEGGQSAGTWRLPKYSELIKSYEDASGSPSGFSGNYWSVISVPTDATEAYLVNMSTAVAVKTSKTAIKYTGRCVR